ncbi:MAG TPA: hypothetical protein DCS93_08395 [Microscillaceae bacterium]|nr:hypothetical protein [Microscillaceae bacterium]
MIHRFLLSTKLFGFSFLLPCCLLISKLGIAQKSKKIATLQQQLNGKLPDTIRYQTLYKLGQLSQLSHRQAFIYYQQALKFAQKIDYPNGVIQALNALGENHFKEKKFNTSLSYFKKALKLAKTQDSPHQIDVLNNLGIFYTTHSLHVDALKQFQAALNIAQSRHLPLGKARTYQFFSKFYLKRGNFKQALDYANKALKIARSQKDRFAEYQFLGQKGRVLMWQGNLNALLANDQQMLDIAFALKDSSSITRSYNNMAGTYGELGKLNKSITLFTKSLHLSRQIADTAAIFATFHNLGRLYSMTKDYTAALKIHKQGIEYASAKQDSALVGVFMMSIAKLYHAKQKYPRAVTYAQQSIPFLKTDFTIFNLGDCYKFLANTYDNLQQFGQAYQYQKLHTWTQDSLFKAQKAKTITKLEQNFQIKEQQKALEALRKEKALQEQCTSFQLKLRNYALLGLILLLFILILLYNRSRLRQRIMQQQSKLLLQENSRHVEETRRLDAEKRLKQEENKRLLLNLDYKNRELATTTMLIQQKNEVLQNIQSDLVDFENQLPKKWSKSIYQIQKTIQTNTNLEEDWERLQLHFNEVHPDFFNKLQTNFCTLSQNDLRLCAYIKINLSNKEIARLLNVEFRSIQMAKYRLKKKLDLSKDDDLNEFIQQL